MNLKRMFQGLAIGTAFLLPFSASAMSPITDNEMSAVTGQSGVSINLDANIHLVVDTIAWGDKDGMAGYASGAGWIGTSGINADVRVRADNNLITTAWANLAAAATFDATASAAQKTATNDFLGATSVLIGQYNAAKGTFYGSADMATILADPITSTLSGYAAFVTTSSSPDLAAAQGLDSYNGYVAYVGASSSFGPLTIDVATDATTGHGVEGTTFVRIGTGSLEVVVSALDVPVALGADPTAVGGLDQELGSLYISGLTLRLAGTSYVDIYNGRATGQGVTLGLNVTIAQFNIGQLSWGDEDGASTIVTNTGAAGYVGLEGLNIAGIKLTGELNIDLATDAAATLYPAGTTFVRLGFDALTVGLGAVDANVVLGDANDFSVNKYYLGSVYMSATTIVLGGYVDVYALDGQSGVSVAFDVNIPSLNIAALSWGDLDGIDAVTPPTGAPADLVTTADTVVDGYVGLKGLTIAGLDLQGGVRIDVATVVTDDLAETSGDMTAGTTFINLGLNGINVGIGEMDARVALGNEKTLATAQELGSIYISGLTTDIDGFLRIYAPSATSQGVVLDLNVAIGAVDIEAVSWGDDDLDNIVDGATAGYAGLASLNITGLTAIGKVAIDVATVEAATPTTYLEMEYAAYYTHNLSPTFVHIGIGSGDAADTTNPLVVTLTSLTADVGLDSVKTLANVAAVVNPTMLGSIYIGGLTASVNGWVDIAAH